MSKLNAKIGVSAIAWLNDDMPELTKHISLEQALSDMQKIGFKGTENSNSFPQTSQELKRLLEKYNLTLVSGWYGGKLGERNLAGEISAIKNQITLFKDLGTDVIVYGETSGRDRADSANPLSQRPKISDYKKYAKKLDDLSKYCNDFGIPLSFHYHMGTIIETMEELDIVMNLTTELHITFDTGHCFMAGGDPIEICRKYANRTNHFHLKDVRQEVLNTIDFNTQSFRDAFLQGTFTVPGDDDGCIDFDAVVQILKNANYQGWFVIEAEQDPKKADPFTYSSMGYKYVYDLLTRHDYTVE